MGGAGEVLDGAGRKVVGGRETRNAMELLMARKIPERMITKPIKKQKKGAKSKFGKGTSKGKTVSSQLGIARFLCARNQLIEKTGLDIGSGRRNSPGNFSKSIP